MIIVLYVLAGIVAAVASLYFAWRSRDFRKFLAGAFFGAESLRSCRLAADARRLR